MLRNSTADGHPTKVQNKKLAWTPTLPSLACSHMFPTIYFCLTKHRSTWCDILTTNWYRPFQQLITCTRNMEKKKNAFLLQTIIWIEHATRRNVLFLKAFFFLLCFQKSTTTGAQDYHTALYSNMQLFQSIFKIKWSNMGRKVEWRWTVCFSFIIKNNWKYHLWFLRSIYHNSPWYTCS